MIRPLTFEVQQYRKRLVIGCAPDEQNGPPQELVFDIVAEIPCRPELLRDTWNPVFDYCILTDAVDAACAAAGVKILQEALAFAVMHRIFTQSDLVERVQVRTRKTERYKDTDAIGFRIDLQREEWRALAAALGPV